MYCIWHWKLASDLRFSSILNFECGTECELRGSENLFPRDAIGCEVLLLCLSILIATSRMVDFVWRSRDNDKGAHLRQSLSNKLSLVAWCITVVCLTPNIWGNLKWQYLNRTPLGCSKPQSMFSFPFIKTCLLDPDNCWKAVPLHDRH